MWDLKVVCGVLELSVRECKTLLKSRESQTRFGFRGVSARSPEQSPEQLPFKYALTISHNTNF